MSGPRVRALLFDYDGLIVDSERQLAECIVEVLAGWGATIGYEDFGHLFGSVDADDVWEELLGSWCGRTLAELEASIGPMVTPRREELELLPGVRELLQEARRSGLRVALGTGNRRDVLLQRLERLGIAEHFDTIVTRADVPRGKPHPDIYLECARVLDVDPAACLVLEDSVPGCEAAVAAGMQVVACPSAVTAHCTFPAEARRVASLLELLGGEGGI